MLLRDTPATARRRPRQLAIGLAIAALFAAPGSGFAQNIRADASWGRLPQTLNGPVYLLPEGLGRVAGSNLFHSFERFGLASGETARFTTATATLQNVFARVTGGQTSVINGLVQLLPAAGSAPDLYLVNPAGVTFGAGASLDVPAAFHTGTANYIKFADGTLWQTGSADSVLISAAPEAFGFLDGQRAPLLVVDGAQLEVAAGLTLAAGDIAVRGANVHSATGDMAVAAIGGIAAEVPLVKARFPDSPAQTALVLPAAAGRIEISGAGEVGSLGTATAGGNIHVSAGQLDLADANSGLGSIATAAGDAGNVTIVVGGALTVAEQASIASSTLAAGNAGTLSITAASASLTDRGVITTATLAGATGDAGRLQLDLAGALTLGNGGIVDSSTFGAGAAGSVDIHAASIEATSGRITSQALPGSNGNAGHIAISVPGTLLLQGGSAISSVTQGAGNAGSVAVTAGNLLATDGSVIVSGADIGSLGQGGSVDITVSGDLVLASGAKIASPTFGPGDAGSVRIAARNIALVGDNTLIDSSAQTGASGDAGTVSVRTDERLILLDGGQIGSNTFGPGNAGSVAISAGEMSISGDATGVASQAQPGSTGHAGDVQVVVAGHLQSSRRGDISSATFAAGNAGAVRVTAGSITLTGDNTLIDSSAQAGASGHAGTVSVRAIGPLSLIDGGQIGSNTFGPGNAGSVAIAAGEMTVSGFATGVASQAQVGSSGQAGGVEVEVAGTLAMDRGGAISSSTFAAGNAGAVVVRAEALTLTGNGTRILSQAAPASTGGHAGDVDIAVTGNLVIADFANIDSSTYAAGNAGTVKVAAGDLTIDGTLAGITSSTFATGHAGTVEVAANNILISGTLAGIGSSTWAAGGGDAGDVKVNTAGTLTLAAGGSIDSSTFGTGNAGSVAVRAASIAMDHAFITSVASDPTSGSAGTIEIISDGTIDMRNAHISSSTNSAGDSGEIRLAAGSLRMDNSSLQNQANTGSSGDAGLIVVLAGDVELRNASMISSATFGSGDAGGVGLRATNLLIDGNGSGLFGTTGPGSTGNAGGILVDVAEKIDMRNDASIDSSTFGSGAAGLTVISARNLSLDNAKITTVSVFPDSGNAGSIEIDVKETASLANGAFISSSTFSAGDAGRVTLHARDLVLDNATIDSQTGAGSSGSGGSVDIAADNSVRLANLAVISSSTLGSGDAGGARVVSPSIAMDQSFIASIAGDVATGNAGIVTVEAPTTLDIANGSLISSSTTSPVGAAGTVQVKAGTLTITGSGDPAVRTGITSDARAGSSGLVGDVTVEAAQGIVMSDGARLSITNESTAAPIPGATGSLAITAPEIILRNRSGISAASLHDIPANAIVINVSDLLMLENSGITTSANNGNGGDIRIGTPKVILLRDALITTSVLGSTGNGGDIAIAGGALILDTGFIQANTAAANAAGGTVLIDVDQLLSSGNSLRVGGNTPYQFTPDVFGANVIQAAAPTGLSGNITISSPPTDIAGSLAELAAPALDLGAFGRDPCGRTAGSSLTTHGRGALPAGPGGFIQPAAAKNEGGSLQIASEAKHLAGFVGCD